MENPVEYPVVFTDSAGYEVSIPAAPQKVAVLFSSFAEIWQLAGGEVAITVGESVERGFVDEDVLLVDDGAGKTIDAELLLSYQPDFVIASADLEGQVDAASIAREAGIPTALFTVENFPDYENVLNICAGITGEYELAKQNGGEVNGQITQLMEKVREVDAAPMDILFIRAGSSASSVKAKTADQHFAAEMLDELGAHNIADDAPVLLDGLSLEEIIVRDPDYIFITTMGDEDAATTYMEELFAGEGWRELTAVRENRYVFLPKDLFHFKPNARWGEAYEYLAQLLYPGILDE